MSKLTSNLAVSAAIAMFGMSLANASILLPADSGGSEAVLTLVNSSNATITQDLGKQIGQISSGNTVALSATVQSFITAAGGLSNVTFGVIAGDSTTRNYLTTTTDATLDVVEIANSERNVWAGTLNNLLGTLNSGDATAASVNNTYGPLATGAAGNYIDGGFDLWNGNYVVNTGPGSSDLALYKVVYGTNNLANATISSFFADPADSFVRLVAGTTNQVQFGPVAAVPLPGSVWLLGTALVGVVGRRWRRATAS